MCRKMQGNPTWRFVDKMIFSDVLQWEWMLSLFRLFAAWKDWMWEWWNEKWGRDKDAVMQQSAVVSEWERAVEDKERQNSSQRNMRTSSAQQRHYTCAILASFSSPGLPVINLLRLSQMTSYLSPPLSAAADPTELEHIESALAGVLRYFPLV